MLEMIFSMLTHYHYLNASIFMTFDWMLSRGWMEGTTIINSDGSKTTMMMIGSRNGPTILVRLILLSIPFFDFFFSSVIYSFHFVLREMKKENKRNEYKTTCL